MIMQSLADYYKRKEGDLPAPGFQMAGIPFILVIDIDGVLVNVEDTRERANGRLQPRMFRVPMRDVRSGSKPYLKPSLLWDTAEFAIGMPPKDKLEKDSDQERKTAEKHQHFVKRIGAMGLDDEGVAAAMKFLDRDPLEEVRAKVADNDLAKELDKAPNVAFQLDTDDEVLICQRPAVAEFVRRAAEPPADPSSQRFCLLTGKQEDPQPLQLFIKNVVGAKTSGATLSTFNQQSVQPHGIGQGENAPMGKTASFQWATALNHLLRNGSRQKIQFGDATTVFWSDRDNHLEEGFAALFDDPPTDDPDRQTEEVRALLNSVRSGSIPPEDAGARFFILGLSPNQSRLSVRFWHTGMVAELSEVLARHFADLEIDHTKNFPDALPMQHLLRSISVLGQNKNIPPGLSGEWIRAILTGAPYPQALFHAALMRNKRSGRPDSWTAAVHEYCRMAIIKACLNRLGRIRQNNEEEITMKLDTESKNLGYILGRLFAVLEIVQERAMPEVNATIRDRYYSGASSTPARHFCTLLRLKNHHLKKMQNPKLKRFWDDHIMEIVSDIPAEGFPAHLSPEDQGRFMIGYYHQRQALLTNRRAGNATLSNTQ